MLFVCLLIYLFKFCFVFSSPPWLQAAGLDPPRVGRRRRAAHRGSRKPNRSLFLPPPPPPRKSSNPSSPLPPNLSPAPVSVSFSFQAWNHLIIAYSFFGRLLNAQPLKGWRKQFTPGYHTQAHSRPCTRTRTCPPARPTARARALQGGREGGRRAEGVGGDLLQPGSICSSQKSITGSRLRKYFCGEGRKKKRSKY